MYLRKHHDSNLPLYGTDSLVDFAPSLCSTAYGIGKSMWATTVHPIDSRDNFINACYEIGESLVECCKNIDEDTFDNCIDQVKEFYARFDNLSETEKGELIGYAIGKYGTDIVLGGTALFCSQ